MKIKIPGKITVSSKAALDVIKHTVLSNNGVYSFAAAQKKDELIHLLRGGLNESGIYITKTKHGLMADIYIILKYGAAAEELREIISSRIKTELECFLHMKVFKINVHIMGVKANGT